MESKIKVNVYWSERAHREYYRTFKIISQDDFEELKKSYDIEESIIDGNSNRREVYNYDYYEYTTIDEDGEEETNYIAVPNGAEYF